MTRITDIHARWPNLTCMASHHLQVAAACDGSSRGRTLTVTCALALGMSVRTLNNPFALRTLRTLDTSDPRQFGTRPMSLVPKCLTFFLPVPKCCRSVFGTLSQHFMKGPKCPTDTSTLVPKCLGQIGGAFFFLYRFTTSRHTSAPSIAISDSV